MKETVIFIPGMMCDKRLFQSQIVEFEKSHNVLVADISHYFTIEESANSVLSLAGKNNRFSLVGLSMGGIISMEVARRISTKISNLILISTTPFSEKKQVKEKRKILIDQVKNGHFVEVMSRHYIQKYFYQHKNKTQLEQLCLAMAQDLGSEAFIRQSEALMTRPCQTGALGTLKCKTLILCGREDQICPLDYHVKIQKLIKHSELVVLDNTGHLPTLEKGQDINLSIKKFMKKKKYSTYT